MTACVYGKLQNSGAGLGKDQELMVNKRWREIGQDTKVIDAVHSKEVHRFI